MNLVVDEKNEQVRREKEKNRFAWTNKMKKALWLCHGQLSISLMVRFVEPKPCNVQFDDTICKTSLPPSLSLHTPTLCFPIRRLQFHNHCAEILVESSMLNLKYNKKKISQKRRKGGKKREREWWSERGHRRLPVPMIVSVAIEDWALPYKCAGII